MFGTSGIRGPVGDEIDASLALSVGRALASTGRDRVVIGRDVRTTGSMLSAALEAGLRECGATVVDVGIEATPTIGRAVGWYGADAGVAVTASHNPPPDNGLKVIDSNGKSLDGPTQETITERVSAGRYSIATWDAVGEYRRQDDARERHRRAIEAAVSIEGTPEVIVDLGNGTGRVTADALRSLGCSVETLNGQRDGRFPGRPSEPTADSCATLRHMVAHGDADLGIAHDGDADRMLAVDETGRFVAGDRLFALLARDAIRRTNVADPVLVAPINTSLAVDDAVEDLGGRVERTPVGDVAVANRLAAVDGIFGGEPSGAWIWPDETMGPDGPLAACRLTEIVAARGSLSAAVDCIPTDGYELRRESMPVSDKEGVMAAVEETVAKRGHPFRSVDGIRVDRGDSWFLIRPSGTEPVVRLTAEGPSEAGATETLQVARTILETACGSG